MHWMGFESFGFFFLFKKPLFRDFLLSFFSYSCFREAFVFVFLEAFFFLFSVKVL